MAQYTCEGASSLTACAHRGGEQFATNRELHSLPALPSGGACHSTCCDARRRGATRHSRTTQLLLFASVFLLVLAILLVLLVGAHSPSGGTRVFRGQLSLLHAGRTHIISWWKASVSDGRSARGVALASPCQVAKSVPVRHASNSGAPPAQQQLLAAVWGLANGLEATACGCSQESPARGFLGGAQCACTSGGSSSDSDSPPSDEACGLAATRHLWGMLLTTAASPAELLLPPSGQQVPHGGSSRSSAAASGWKPFLSTVPELQEQAPANSARILAAAATFVQKLQLLAAVSPAAAAAGLSLDELHVTLSSKRRLRQAAAAAAKASTTVGGSAAGRVDDAQQGQQQPAAEHPGAAADHVGGAGTDGNDRMGPQLERELQAFLSRALSEVKAIEDGARAQATGISQSFPLARRSVVAALAACALLLDATAAGAAHRTPQPPVAAGAWAAELDAQVQQLLGQLYSLHRNGAVHKQGVDHLHVSKSGGTSFTELSEFNGCACTSRSDNGLLPAPWDDRPRWLDGEAAKRALGLDRSGKPSVMDGWSDSGPRQPQSYGGGDVSRATAAGYCRARTNALSARFLQFATNEYTLYGGQDSPRDTFICPELLNTIVVREPRARMVSHMHYMLPHFVSLLAGSDAAFRRGGAVSRAADWDRIAPFPFDNYLTRSLLGEAVFRSPVGRLGDAARFWADVGSSSPAANTTSSSIVAAALRRLKVDEAANAKLATAARLVLQQFDVVMALEDGEANRPHIQRALGWPYPLDLVRKRVSAENLETNVQVELAELLPDDMAELRARHTKLDDVTYRYGQLFSKLDLVVWDTAAQLEAQACPGNTGSERGSALVAQAANQQAITAHVAAAEAAASVAGGDASSGQQQQQQQPQQQHHHHYRSAAEVARGQQALRARRSRGAAAAAASRKLLMSSAARDVMRYAQRVAAEALHSSMGGQLTSRLTGLQDWNVTRAVLEGQGQAQVGDGRVCSEVAAAAWGSVTGTCGWVGISRWAVTLQAQGRLK